MVHEGIVGSSGDGQIGLWSNGLDICSPDWRSAIRYQDPKFLCSVFSESVYIFSVYKCWNKGGLWLGLDSGLMGSYREMVAGILPSVSLAHCYLVMAVADGE